MNKRRRYKAKRRRRAIRLLIERRPFVPGELIHLKTRYAVSREFGIVMRCEGLTGA